MFAMHIERTALALCAATLLTATAGAADVVAPPATGEAQRLTGAAPLPPGAPGCAATVGDLLNPGPVVHDGDVRLYLGNNQNNTANLITVVNIATPGGEFVEDELETPVNPVDLAVVNNVLYVIDQHRDTLHIRTADSGQWLSIPLPNGTVTEWTYGDIIYAHDGRMYIIHTWEGIIDVVDLNTHAVVDEITDLDFLPNRIVFTGDNRMVVLGVGLSAPSCSAFGPNFAVFDLDTLDKAYQQSIAGACPQTLSTLGDSVYIAFSPDAGDNFIRRYDLDTGAQTGELIVPNVGRHMTTDGTRIMAQTYSGDVLTIEPDLSSFEIVCNVLEGPQTWFPPIEEMVAMPPDDGRVFVTNRNDDVLSIVTLDVAAPCLGDLNSTETVDVADLLAMLQAWGPCDNCAEDLDASGGVGVNDLLTLLSAWGPCD